MTLSDHQFEFIKDVVKLINKAIEFGFKVTGGELYRPQEMQNYYFEKGLTKTKASNHLLKCAIDLNFFMNGKLTYEFKDIKPLGDYWESLNKLNRWGGDWNKNDIEDERFTDTPHFERNIINEI